MANIQEKIEDKIIDCVNSGSGGRLIIFKPEKSGLEDYLFVERRGKYRENPIYFRIISLVVPAKQEIFVQDFPQEEFNPDKNFNLIFVCFNEVLQKINDYVWLIPSLQFRAIAPSVKFADGKHLLRFQAPLDIKKKDQYSKFLINIKDLGRMILDAFERGGEFDFAKKNLEAKTINLNALREFICEARKNTYAASASPVDNPRLLASVQLEFEKRDFFYRDVYFSGDKKFIGQEIVYQNLKPIWGMNYMGDQIGKTETIFLKESLLNLCEKCRLGGTCEHERGVFKYQDSGQGSFEEFSGEEKILSRNKGIYKLNYQGGLILNKP